MLGGIKWFLGVLGVLSSMSQYSKVFVIWFLTRFVMIRKFKMSFKWFGICYEDVWWWFRVVLCGFGVF